MVKTIFDPDLAQKLLTERSSGWRLRYYPSCESTQTLAREAVSKDPLPGLVIVTDHQLSGRGRQGGSWSDSAGTGLLFSTVLDRIRASPLLPLLAGISVADAVQQISGLQPTLKWPNDVLCGALKLAGILAEASADWVVLGIGVNVNTPGDELPESGTSIMALTGRPTSREALLAAILDELDRNITKSSRSGDSWIVGQWRARAAILGEPIEVSLAGKQQTGVAEDIDETGRLWIRLATGERIPLVAGQVRWLRPVPGQS